jgi:hypothetical protein
VGMGTGPGRSPQITIGIPGAVGRGRGCAAVHAKRRGFTCSPHAGEGHRSRRGRRVPPGEFPFDGNRSRSERQQPFRLFADFLQNFAGEFRIGYVPGDEHGAYQGAEAEHRPGLRLLVVAESGDQVQVCADLLFISGFEVPVAAPGDGTEGDQGGACSSRRE